MMEYMNAFIFGKEEIDLDKVSNQTKNNLIN